MKKYIFGTLLFIIVTFIVQSTSHFVINAEHYALVSFTRKEVIFPLGFLTMLLQGIVLSFFFILYCKNEYIIKKGLFFGLLMSALFVSYPTFTEPAKYLVPNIGSWILVEGLVGLIQFCLFGVLLSLTYKKLK
ncbi:MAG: hypothetical protein COB60_11650 [Flavobacteriaceae bacterium]|nr:MAG: hypothetical protein COB60_11650 [Flavobacteriaceae bacterium]